MAKLDEELSSGCKESETISNAMFLFICRSHCQIHKFNNQHAQTQ